MLVKVHGDFKNDNFVFTEDSYVNYDKNFKLIKNFDKNDNAEIIDRFKKRNKRAFELNIYQ